MKHSRITVCLFLLCLGVFTALSLFSPETIFSQKENRFLQTKPSFSIRRLMNRTFGSEYEDYLSDQFPFRDRWISLHAKMEHIIGKTEINSVYVGKDDYLMEVFSASVFESEQTKTNLTSLGQFTDFLQAQSLPISIMIIPTASEILQDKLPPFASPYPQTQFLEQIKYQVGETASVSGACASTLSSHSDESIYYRTDHHWTSLGAFYAYTTWASNIGLTPFTKEDFQIQTVSSDFYGTIDAKLPLANTADCIETYTNKLVSFQAMYNQNPTDIRNSLFDETFLSKRDKYSSYLGGNYGLIEITTRPIHSQNFNQTFTKIPDHLEDTYPQNNLVSNSLSTKSTNRRLLILKDSYANCFVPIAAGHFSYTAVIDPRFFSDNLVTFIEKNSITDVLVLYSASGFAQDRYLSRLISSGYSN